MDNVLLCFYYVDGIIAVSYTHLDVYKRQHTHTHTHKYFLLLLVQETPVYNQLYYLIQSLNLILSPHGRLYRLFLNVLSPRSFHSISIRYFLHGLLSLLCLDVIYIPILLRVSWFVYRLLRVLLLLATQVQASPYVYIFLFSFLNLLLHIKYRLLFLPVSYTHLDVYKRQLLAGRNKREAIKKVQSRGCLLYTSRCV